MLQGSVVVVEKKVADRNMTQTTAASADDGAIHRELICDGVKFHWWAVGEYPTRVTVINSVFGSLAEFTRGDPAEFAMELAGRILVGGAVSQEGAGADVVMDETTSFEKTGWFERSKKF